MRYERSSAISNRHRLLLDLIQQGDHSTRSLAEELEVSEPTVSRDIEFLRDQGYEIQAIRVDRKWAYRVVEMLVREGTPNPVKKGKRK